jgi:peptidoglycan L-alanyl-D-glutamate endopeptidase CwlK
MDNITLERIKTLHLKLRSEAEEIYKKICEEMPTGTICRFTHTLRTNAEQNELYALGRTKPGKIVTNAKGGDSYHNYGLAIDFVLIVNGKASWTVNKDWLKVIEIFQSYGWESGHYWKFKDSPHVQKTFGKTIKQLKEQKTQYPEL